MIRDPDTAKAKIQELCRRGEAFLEAAISGESHTGEFKGGEFRSRHVEVPVMFNGSP